MNDTYELAYIADNVMVSLGQERIHDAVLGIDPEAHVVLLRSGDEPVTERVIAAAPAVGDQRVRAFEAALEAAQAET